MKRLLTFLALACAAATSFGATLNPVQLLNPAGSTSGQAIVSTGASSAPAWGNVTAAALAAQAANTVVANATGASAAPIALAVPSCSATGNALNWTSGTGFSCATGYAPLASPALTGTPTAPLQGNGANGNQVVTAAFVQNVIGTSISATPKSRVIATNTSAQSIPNNTATVVTNWTSVLNTGSNFVTSTGVYTVPSAGQYRVTAQLQYGAATWASGTFLALQINQNGASKYLNTNLWGAAQATGQYYTAPVSVILNCAANDTISISAFHAQGAAVTIGNSALSNFLMIEQLP